MKFYYALASICFSFLCTNGYSQTHNWTGNGGDTNWFNAANWDAGTVPMLTSTVAISGNVAVNILSDDAEAFSINLNNNATLDLAGNLQTDSVITIDPTSVFIFTSGTLQGSDLSNFGLLKLEGDDLRTFNATSITNHADFLVTQSNQTQVLNTTINNMSTGVIDISSVGGFLQQATSSVLNNEGSIKKRPDGINQFGNFYLILEINNEGTIEVQEDQIFLLLAGSSTFTNFDTGHIIGMGTYDITTTFINEGTISPGSSGSIGNLDVTNNFSLNNGTIAVDLAGVQPDEFDSIAIFGSPMMEGVLRINLQFSPQLGDEFSVVTWNQSGSSCSFPRFSSAVFEGVEYTFETFCNANDVTIQLVEISVLGVNDIASNDIRFYVHPNPVGRAGSFIFSSEWITPEETTLDIYNYLGQRVLTMDGFTSETNTFHRGNLPAGVYFAQVAYKGSIIATTKLVLN